MPFNSIATVAERICFSKAKIWWPSPSRDLNQSLTTFALRDAIWVPFKTNLFTLGNYYMNGFWIVILQSFMKRAIVYVADILHKVFLSLLLLCLPLWLLLHYIVHFLVFIKSDMMRLIINSFTIIKS